MFSDTSPPQFPHTEASRDFAPCASPLPKLEFPKFDGDNPQLWRDHCEMFLEVYSVGDHLETRFGVLNFRGAADSWLRTEEMRP